MHREGRIVGLLELLGVINPLPPRWHLTFLWAMKNEGSTLNIAEFEAANVKSPIILDRDGLVALASDIFQVIDCDLYGFSVGSRGVDPEAAAVVIRAMDSSYWELEVDESSVHIDKESPLFSE